MGIAIKRGDLTGYAAQTYIPRRGRGARHYADGFSSSLWLCKVNPEVGAIWAHDFARALVELVPDGTQLVVTPPAGRRRSAAGWYFARELGAGVARLLGVPLARPLAWANEGLEASKNIVHQGGKGRALGRRAVCYEDLAGVRCCLIDDLFTTGITLELCGEALREVGAEWPVGVVCLGATERTEARPAAERERLNFKRTVRARRVVATPDRLVPGRSDNTPGRVLCGSSRARPGDPPGAPPDPRPDKPLGGACSLPPGGDSRGDE